MARGLERRGQEGRGLHRAGWGAEGSPPPGPPQRCVFSQCGLGTQPSSFGLHETVFWESWRHAGHGSPPAQTCKETVSQRLVFIATIQRVLLLKLGSCCGAVILHPERHINFLILKVLVRRKGNYGSYDPNFSTLSAIFFTCFLKMAFLTRITLS